MYHWSIFVVTAAITEIIANVVTGTLFFIPWYFAVGFKNDMIGANARGVYEWILFVSYLSLTFPSSFIISIEII